MKKKLLNIFMIGALSIALLTGCGGPQVEPIEDETVQTQDASDQSDVEEAKRADETSEDMENSNTDTQESEDAEKTDNSSDASSSDVVEKTLVRLGGLKGPTTMGLVQLLKESADGITNFDAQFSLAAAADELTPSFIQGELDMIAVPANLASVLYNKTEGKVSVLAVNTLGVLSIVDTKDSVKSLEDLKGKTLYATGQGTTPEYVLRYLLTENGIDPDKDVTIEWKSEAAEVLSVMVAAANGEEVIAMLPQPFVTVAQTQLPDLQIAVDFNDEWNKLGNGSSLVTGVLIARNDFIEENKETVDAFLDAYKESAAITDENIDAVAGLIEEFDIVKAPIAKNALPYCNITFMEGEDMKQALMGYLEVLSSADPKSIGGSLPGDDFYYAR